MIKMVKKITNEEKEMRARELRWRAEEDARIMAQYQEIMNDKSRMNRATKEAQRQANDLQKRVDAMKGVANRKRGK